MDDTRLVLAIVQREQSEEYIAFFKRHQVASVTAMLCRGTAKKMLMDMLGLESKDKVMLCCLTDAENARLLRRRLIGEMRIEAPNMGIAMSVMLDSDETEVSNVEKTPYVLLVAIDRRGYSDTLMEVARAAGATGGTILHAKGTGADIASKFFGMSIADEKEALCIVAKRGVHKDIMDALKEHSRTHEQGHCAVFSLPVDSVTGMYGMED